ncbi:MAG: IS3 family transposase [Cellvibrionaceae bacterium]|nr:IS3 family transposase [Cellvibrionaceae bacterium]
MRYAFIAEELGCYSVSRLCSVMQVSRRGFYDWMGRSESERASSNRVLLTRIWELFIQYREVYGAPRIHKALLAEGYDCGLNRVARLMRENNIVPKTIRKFRTTTDSRRSRAAADNILARDFEADRPNEKWVADVTFIPTREGWLFLATVLDLFSRKIVGWSMGSRLTSGLAQTALQNAIDARSPEPGLIVHSDRGKEYHAGEYQQLLKRHGLICSMSARGDCYDNAVMESFFHSLKVEEVHHQDFRTRAEARAALFDYIEIFYNRQRLHSSIGYQSPVEFENELLLN